MDNTSKAVLDRPVSDYLTGYQHGGRWVPGMLQAVATLQSHDSWYIRAILFLGLLRFFGVQTIQDVIHHLPPMS